MLIQLGNFQFSISTLAYKEIERVSSYSFASHQVIGSYNRLQAVGVNNETLSFTGDYYADFRNFVGSSSSDPFEEIRNIANEQKPLQLQSEDGKNHGYWVITELNVKGSHYIEQGALKASFTIQLTFYGRRLQ